MLRDLQDAFRRGVLEDDGGDALALIRADAIPAERRLAIYRNNTIGSLVKTLMASYPVVCRLVGERFFRNAACAFIRAEPPRQPQQRLDRGDVGTVEFDLGHAGFTDREIASLHENFRAEGQRRIHTGKELIGGPGLAGSLQIGDTGSAEIDRAEGAFHLGLADPRPHIGLQPDQRQVEIERGIDHVGGRFGLPAGHADIAAIEGIPVELGAALGVLAFKPQAGEEGDVDGIADRGTVDRPAVEFLIERGRSDAFIDIHAVIEAAETADIRPACMRRRSNRERKRGEARRGE